MRHSRASTLPTDAGKCDAVDRLSSKILGRGFLRGKPRNPTQGSRTHAASSILSVLVRTPFDRNANKYLGLGYRARYIAVNATKSYGRLMIEGKVTPVFTWQAHASDKHSDHRAISAQQGNSEGGFRCRLAQSISPATAPVARTSKVAASWFRQREPEPARSPSHLRTPVFSLRRPSGSSYSDSGFAPVGRAGGRSG